MHVAQSNGQAERAKHRIVFSPAADIFDTENESECLRQPGINQWHGGRSCWPDVL